MINANAYTVYTYSNITQNIPKSAFLIFGISEYGITITLTSKDNVCVYISA
jgi:hypothetical protein